MDKRRKTPDCYEDEFCANFKTAWCSSCERNFKNFDIQDHFHHIDLLNVKLMGNVLERYEEAMKKNGEKSKERLRDGVV